MSQVRILLADDHHVIRAGLKLLLEREPSFVVVGDAGDGRSAVSLAESLTPDIAILDIAMPNLNGIEAARQIKDRLSRTSVIMLSMHADEAYVLRSLKAGARGYLLKDSAESDLIGAVKAVSEGKAFFSPRVSKMLVDDHVRRLREHETEDSYELLSPREREILQLVAEGRSNKEIAAMLNVSPYTVETHRSHLSEKLNVKSVPELILYAVRKGLIS